MPLAQSLLTVSHVLAILLAVGLQLALVVVALTVVRAHRPDAMGWMLLAGLMGLLGTVLRPILAAVAFAVASRYGVGHIVYVQTGVTVVGSLWGALEFVVLLVAVVRLARPTVERSL